jgi:hypothetical protein
MRRIVAMVVAVPVALALLVAWFGWTAKETGPRDLPIVVAGPPRVTAAVADQLAKSQPGAFHVTQVSSADEADKLLRNHSAYGAIILGEGVSLHTASGASPVVAEFLRQMANEFGNRLQVTVVDVVPGSPADPRGSGFASGYVPLVLAAMVAGVLAVLLLRTRTRRLIGILGFAVAAGLAGAAMMHWLDLLTGSYLMAAAAISLLAVAVSAGVGGLGALLGPPGLGLGVVIVFLIGNPIAAVALVPELLPQPWGAVGQLLPAGAGVSLLRAVTFYDGAGAITPLLTLAAWAVVGVALLLLGGLRQQRASAPAPAGA